RVAEGRAALAHRDTQRRAIEATGVAHLGELAQGARIELERRGVHPPNLTHAPWVPHGDPGLREPAEALAPDLAVREEPAHLAPREQARLGEVALDLRGRRPREPAPGREPAQEPALHAAREPVHARREHVRLEREALRRRLPP